jgi:hypothetical protein
VTLIDECVRHVGCALLIAVFDRDVDQRVAVHRTYIASEPSLAGLRGSFTDSGSSASPTGPLSILPSPNHVRTELRIVKTTVINAIEYRNIRLSSVEGFMLPCYFDVLKNLNGLREGSRGNRSSVTLLEESNWN